MEAESPWYVCTWAAIALHCGEIDSAGGGRNHPPVAHLHLQASIYTPSAFSIRSSVSFAPRRKYLQFVSNSLVISLSPSPSFSFFSLFLSFFSSRHAFLMLTFSNPQHRRSSSCFLVSGVEKQISRHPYLRNFWFTFYLPAEFPTAEGAYYAIRIFTKAVPRDLFNVRYVPEWRTSIPACNKHARCWISMKRFPSRCIPYY